jgi:hypothetical protein
VFNENETPQEHIRNAMAILLGCAQAWASNSEVLKHPDYVAITSEDFDAAVNRLNVAVAKLELEAAVAKIRTVMHGDNRDCPDVQAGRATRCPGHHA